MLHLRGHKTFTPSGVETAKNRKWYIIDATDLVLGRLCVQTAVLLRGKHKPEYTPNIDTGDHVIVINADKVYLTGDKLQSKKYYKHTGHPGGIKETTPEKILAGKHPERVIEMGVKNMLNRGPLSYAQLTRLHVYAGENNPHSAQNPEKIEFSALSKKNKKRS